MTKIFALIKNEFVKQYKKISIKVIIGLILLSTLAAPLLFKYMANKEANAGVNVDYLQNDVNYNKATLSDLKDKNDIASKIFRDMTQVSLDATTLKIEEKISWEDWRGNSVDMLLNNQHNAIVIKAILDGHTNMSAFELQYFVDSQTIESYIQMPKEELEKLLATLNTNIDTTLQTIKNNDHKKYVESNIKETENSIAESKKQILELEKTLKESSTKKDIQTQIDSIKQTIKLNEEILSIDKFRLENNIPFDRKDWRHETIRRLKDTVQELSNPKITEEEFKNQYQYQIQQGYTYQDYQADYDKNAKINKDRVDLNWYSLKNNIPRVGTQSDARDLIDKLYLLYVTIAIVLCIIIAGSIVSTEFSKGTVRLLMIRPVSRFKILLSKLVTVFIIGYVTLSLCFILLSISSGAVFGFESLSIPQLAINNGVISESNFILSLIPNLLYCSIGLIFAIALSFALSTIVKNTAVSVGLTSVLFFGGSTATMLLAQFKMTWVANTILPYMNLSSFIGEHSYNYMKMMKENFNLSLDPSIGVTQMLILSVILVLITFVSFKKTDVKN